MIFFGWGTKNKSWLIPKVDKHLIATWTYFHIFWIPIGYNIKWHVVGDSRAEDLEITYDNVKEMFKEDVPKVSIWQKYGLLFVIVAAILVSALGF